MPVPPGATRVDQHRLHRRGRVLRRWTRTTQGRSSARPGGCSPAARRAAAHPNRIVPFSACGTGAPAESSWVVQSRNAMAWGRGVPGDGRSPTRRPVAGRRPCDTPQSGQPRRAAGQDRCDGRRGDGTLSTVLDHRRSLTAITRGEMLEHERLRLAHHEPERGADRDQDPLVLLERWSDQRLELLLVQLLHLLEQQVADVHRFAGVVLDVGHRLGQALHDLRRRSSPSSAGNAYRRR